MIRAAIVGATGVVGQQFISALNHHPWFDVSILAASERSAQKTYEEALRDEKTGSIRWYCDEPPPNQFLEMKVENAASLDLKNVDLIFTGIESEQAQILEPRFAKERPVISTASAFRYESDVPILVPGVNLDHAKLIDLQKKNRGWRGFITPIPNCTTTGLVVSLKPVYDDYGIDRVVMTSMQAVSGAGRSPGVLALDLFDNIIPLIPGEEEKVQTETLKILGRYDSGCLKHADFKVSCTCTRVNVREGHTEAVFLSAKKRCEVDDVRDSMRRFGGVLRELGLPSAPEELLTVNDDPFRPQPRLDRNVHGGMSTVVGRIRKDNALDNGIKYLLVSHNTKMGAAKGAVLVAEYLVKSGYV